jgi:hypothetical protein
MYKKDYYRLSELSSKAEFSVEDYKYFIENHKETLYFRLHDQPVVLIDEIPLSDLEGEENAEPPRFDNLMEMAETVDNAKTEYRGQCVGRYSGLVRLTKKDKNTLLRENAVQTYQIVIDDIKGIKSQVDKYPFKTTLPNEYLSEWGGLNLEARHGLKALIVSTDSGELSISLKTVNLDDLLIPAEVTEFFDTVFNPQSDDIKKESSSSSLQSIPTRGIDIVIAKAIDVIPTAKPSVIWNILAQDITQQPRVYDTDEIIEEIGEKVLYWTDIDGEEKSLKKKSFYQLFKKLNENKRL